MQSSWLWAVNTKPSSCVCSEGVELEIAGFCGATVHCRMTEDESGEARRMRSWNSSTKLTQPRRARTGPRGRHEVAPRRERTGQARNEDRRSTRDDVRNQEGQVNDDRDQRTLTRELLERALSTAFGGLLQDSTLDATAFPDVQASQSSDLSDARDKENNPPAKIPATEVKAKLRSTLEASASLSVNHRQRRREHTEALQQATADFRAAREFQRRMKHATFEHRERKMAVQTLQSRIQREIQFLTATAADLEKREFLLDDAFESYERALRLELDLNDDESPSNQQKQAEESSRPS